MKFTEKNLSELKQLDRIEFRQKYDRLKGKYNSSIIGLVIILIIMLGVVFTFCSLVLIVNGTPGAMVSINGWMDSFAMFTIFSIIGAVIVDLLMCYMFVKEREKLIKEYFKLNLKKK